MEERDFEARSILTKQSGGFLTAGRYPITHSLSAYVGCGFGATTCGMYCYAQHLPNWTARAGTMPWGGLVLVKVNAPALLAETLRRLAPAKRQALRIFMSSATDPYQPAEARRRLTRQCLEVFARHVDLDLLIVQTRAPLAERDFDLLASIPYAWLSVSVETDDARLLRDLRGGPSPARRLALAHAAARRGIRTQITVSPCLPHGADFAATLAATGVQRVVVDTFTDGDGSGGRRTGATPYAEAVPDWRDPTPARDLFRRLRALGVPTGWSAEGFYDLPPRHQDTEHAVEATPGGLV